MDGGLEAHRRCLAAMREACAAQPEPHANQLAALERELALAATGDLAGYLSASGGLFELTRAGSLDRAANQARVAAAVGDTWRTRAAAAEHAGGLAATGAGDWALRAAAGAGEAAGLRERGANARGAFLRVLLGLIALHATADELERDQLRLHAASALDLLLESDPAFAWAGLHAQPRYALRVPWTGEALATVGGWIEALGAGGEPAAGDDDPEDALAAMEEAGARWRAGLGGEAAHAAAEPSAAPALPSVEEALAPYRALARAATGDDPLTRATRHAAEAALAAGAGAPTGPDATARLVASGLLADLAAAPLRARAEAALERRALWPDPLLGHHWRAVLDALDVAATPTAVDLVSEHAEACLAVEADWNAILLGSLLAPLRAACLEGRAGLERATAQTVALFGLCPRQIASLPRVADFGREILFPLATRDPGAVGAFDGEAGWEVVTAARNRLEEAGARPADGDHLLAMLLGGPPEPAPAARSVTLWGEPIELGRLTDSLSRPARPPIPGLRGIAGTRVGL